MEKEEIFKPDDLGGDCICFECHYNNTCKCCGIIKTDSYRIKYGTYCSENCLKDTKYFPGLKSVISTLDFLRNKERYKHAEYIDLLTYVQMGGE